MKRYLVVLAAACALLLALAASPAFAGGGLLGGSGSQEQSVTNSTDQSNQAGAINVPILSGNNVAVLSGGDQSNSAGTSQNQANVNGTSQQADQSQNADPSQEQSTSNSTDQQNEAQAVNVPIASGNNVAILSGGDQSNSAGVEQNQANVNGTSQQADQSQSGSDSSNGCPQGSNESQAQDQSTSNHTEQENEATAVNVPIASGNNVAVLSGGSQSNSAGVEQNQANLNVTKQEASQTGSGGDDSIWKHDSSSSQEQSVRNSTSQENEARAINVPIVSGNNVALFSFGRQSNSAGVEQNQVNVNVTKQEASQTGSSPNQVYERQTYEKTYSRCDEHGKGGEKQSVRNYTSQENEAWALNVPILSGNNLALFSFGRQSSSAGVEQNQANVNVTKQEACRLTS